MKLLHCLPFSCYIYFFPNLTASTRQQAHLWQRQNTTTSISTSFHPGGYARRGSLFFNTSYFFVFYSWSHSERASFGVWAEISGSVERTNSLENEWFSCILVWRYPPLKEESVWQHGSFFFFFGYFKTCAEYARSVYSFFLLAPVDGFNQRVGSAWARWVVVVITTKKSILSVRLVSCHQDALAPRQMAAGSTVFASIRVRSARARPRL